MKHLIFIFVFCVSTVLSFAQFKKGDWELRWNGNAGKYDLKDRVTSGGPANETSLGSRLYMNGSLCAGYYIMDGVSVEGEFSLYAREGAALKKYFLFNLSYTHYLPKTGTAPFVHAGYGRGGGFIFPDPYPSSSISFKSTAWGVSVLNLGAGVKYILAKNIAATLELNYRSQSFDESQNGIYTDIVMVDTITLRTFGLLFGISVIL